METLKLCRVRLIIDHRDPAPVVAVAESTVELRPLGSCKAYYAVAEQPQGDIVFGKNRYVPESELMQIYWDVFGCDTAARSILMFQTYCLPSQLASAKAFVREAAKYRLKKQIATAENHIEFYKSQLEQI